MIVDNHTRKVFSTYKSMDDCQKMLIPRIKHLTPSERMIYWADVFNESDSLGKPFNNANQVRGRAGELMCLSNIQKVLTDYPTLNKVSSLYHSFHFEGTEQDILLVTDRVFYMIEVKSQKSSSNKRILKTAEGGIDQNLFHVERFDKFLEKKFGYKKDIRAEMFLVYVKSGISDKIESHNGYKVVPIQLLYNLIVETYHKNKGYKIPNYSEISSKIDKYYNSGDQFAQEISHKKRLGYK